VIYILFDESGDLGFDLSKKGTSKYFFVSFLITNNKQAIEKSVSNTIKTLSKSQIKRRGGVLHAYYEDVLTRKTLLRALSKKDIRIAIMKLDKEKIVVHNDSLILYSSMVTALINHLYWDKHLLPNDVVRFIASQMGTNAYHNENFLSAVENGTNEPHFSPVIAKPIHEKSLQAADFVSWSFSRKYEQCDAKYSDIVQSKVIAEYDYC
jgi:hypothetical protein